MKHDHEQAGGKNGPCNCKGQEISEGNCGVFNSLKK